MSVWSSVEALQEYVYQSSHAYVFRKRKDWFEEITAPSLALWWIPAGLIPTIEDGKLRLEMLEKNGVTPDAFTFKETFPPPQ
jgi:hypothetical protein